MHRKSFVLVLLLTLLTGCATLDPATWTASDAPTRSAETPQKEADAAEASRQPTGNMSGPPIADAIGPAYDDSGSALALASHQQPSDEPRDQVEQMPSPEAPNPLNKEEWTLADLEQIALANNPALSEAWARVRAAEGNWLQVGLPPNIEFGYSGQQLGSKGLAEQEGVFVGQEFVWLRKLRLNRAVAAQQINVARQQAQMRQQRLLTDVRLGFYEMLVAQRRVDLTAQLVSINRGAVEIAQSLFEAQEVGQPDVLRATVQLQSSELSFRAAQNQYEAAWSKLTAVLGTPDIAPQRIAGQLEAEFEAISREDALARILNISPEVATVLADVQRARFAVDRARIEPLPNLDVQGVVQADNSTGSSNGMLQVTFPFPWLNRNQGGIRQAEAEVAAAQRAVNRTQLSLQRRLATVYQQYATALVRVEGYRREGGILDNVQKSLEAIRANYRGGETSYIDLLTAQRTYAQMNLAYVESIGELWAALVEIEGLLLKDSLDAPPN